LINPEISKTIQKGIQWHQIGFFSRVMCSKGKVDPITGNKDSEVKLYRSTLSLTSALEGLSVQRHAPAALHLGKENSYTLNRRLVGLQGRSEQVRNISPPPGLCFPGQSSPWRVAILTELSRPTNRLVYYFKKFFVLFRQILLSDLRLQNTSVLK